LIGPVNVLAYGTEQFKTDRQGELQTKVAHQPEENRLQRVLDVGQAKTGQVGDGFPAVLAVIATDINPFQKIGLNGVTGIKAVFFRGNGNQAIRLQAFLRLGKGKFPTLVKIFFRCSQGVKDFLHGSPAGNFNS